MKVPCEGLRRSSEGQLHFGPRGQPDRDTAVKSAMALEEWPSLARMEGSFRRKVSMRVILTEAGVGRQVTRGIKNVT